MRNPSKRRSPERIAIAAEYLKLAQADIDRARTTRLHYAHLARSYGMSNGEIGAAIGVSEAAVRALLKRNPEAA